MSRNLFFLALMSLIMMGCSKQSDGLPKPSQAQKDWFDMERYAFVHFSINTYTDQEWGFGNESPELFNPDSLDCRQWAKTCHDAGFTGIIVTAKHHAGFCLWPSEYTDYSVKNSPWKDGKGDVLQELREACDEYGLKLGMYLSPWDRNRADYGEPSYIEYFRNQLTELLTNYGDIFEVWFDGANGGNGYYGGANENRNIDRATYYDWPGTIELVRELQPNCIIWNEIGPDARWCGNEKGSVGETNWNRYDYNGHIPGAPGNKESLREGEIDGPDFVAAEVNVSTRPGWFYHEFEDMKVKSLKKLFDIYLSSVGRGATWLLNFPIDTHGKIHQNDVDAVLQLNDYLKETFTTDLAQGGKLKKKGNKLIMTLPSAVEFNLVDLREDMADGQTIDSFTVLADGDTIASGTTVGNRRILQVPNTKATEIQVVVTTIDGKKHLPSLALYLAPEIPDDSAQEVYQLDRSKWTVVAPTGDDTRLMLDGDKSTMWQGDGLPTDVVIDLGDTYQLTGFRYLPDQGDYHLRGIITNYEFEVSQDGQKWQRASSGEFSNIANNPLWQVVKFSKPQQGHYIRFRGLKNHRNTSEIGIAEFDVLTD